MSLGHSCGVACGGCGGKLRLVWWMIESHAPCRICNGGRLVENESVVLYAKHTGGLKQGEKTWVEWSMDPRFSKICVLAEYLYDEHSHAPSRIQNDSLRTWSMCQCLCYVRLINRFFMYLWVGKVNRHAHAIAKPRVRKLCRNFRSFSMWGIDNE